MKITDIFSYAFSAIKLRKLRAGLTTLGVVIGIAAIVALLSITQGLQVAIATQLQKGFATDTLIVTARSESGFKLLVNDTKTIEEIGGENVTVSLAVILRTGYIKSGGQTSRVTIVGVDYAKYAEIYSSTFTAEEGAIPQNPENSPVVVGKRVSDPWSNGTLFCRPATMLKSFGLHDHSKTKPTWAMLLLSSKKLEDSALEAHQTQAYTYQ
jgi:putative ABC transport system permease protein